MTTTVPEKKVLTIERAKWRRGGDIDELVTKFGSTALLNPEGFMCCLGFDAAACGVPAEAMMNISEPSDVRGVREYPAYAVWPRFHVDSEFVDQVASVNTAMTENDKIGISADERERRVREALIDLGWDDVVFV